MQADAGAEQVPQHQLRVAVDEDGRHKVELSVKLPGLSSAADILLRCSSSSSISLRVPGRYALQLPLSVAINDAAESVKFNKKKETLCAKFVVLSTEEAAAAAAAAAAGGGASNGAAAAAAMANGTAGPAAAAAGDSGSAGKQQQQQQQQVGVGGGGAAAAEESRRAAQRVHEEAQRREQQRRINAEAAQEWMRRGLEAAALGNTELAQKALNKIGELHPDLNTVQLRTAFAAAKQQQQQQQHGPQAAAADGGSSSSSQQQAPPKQQQQQQQAPPKQQQQQQQAPPKQQQQGSTTQPSSSSSSTAPPSTQQQSSSSSGSAQQQSSRNGTGSAAHPGGQQQSKQKHKQKQQQQKQQQQQQKQQQQKQQQKQQGASSSGSAKQGTAGQRQASGAAAAAGDGHAAAAEGGPDQQQQQQQGAEGENGFARSAWEQQQAAKASGGGLVGWWCRQYDALELWLTDAGARLLAWADEPERSVAARASAKAAAVLLVAAHFAVMWTWRMGWTQPLYVAAYIRRAGGDSYIESQLWLGRTGISLTQHTLAAAAWRLSLFSLSAACVAAAAWAVALLQLAGHSLVGWAWVVAAGVWRTLVWRPWHSVQLVLATVAAVLFGVGGVGGSLALWSLQMLLAPGGWLTLWSWLGSWLLHLRLLPSLPPLDWASAATAAVLTAHAVNYGCRWWGFEAFVNPVDPLPRVSWWWWLLLVALYCGLGLLQAAEKLHQEGERAKGGGASSTNSSSSWGHGDHTDDEPFYGGDASDIAYTKYVMGFGPVPVPEGCEVAEVREVLQARDYYQVMGFAARESCTSESLRAARRVKALAVHPDKVGHDHPGANLAAGRVNKAFETLSSPESRRAYDRLLDCHSRPRAPRGRAAAAGSSGGMSASPDDAAWLPPFSDSLYDIDTSPAYMSDMPCPSCNRVHTVYILPQAPFGVRWCRECAAWHATSSSRGGGGEVWAHWSPGLGGLNMLGRSRMLFAPGPDAPIIDVTDICKCGGLATPPEMCNTHTNPLAEMMARGPRGAGSKRGGGPGGGAAYTDSGGSRRSRKKQGRRR